MQALWLCVGAKGPVAKVMGDVDALCCAGDGGLGSECCPIECGPRRKCEQLLFGRPGVVGRRDYP